MRRLPPPVTARIMELAAQFRAVCEESGAHVSISVSGSHLFIDWHDRDNAPVPVLEGETKRVDYDGWHVDRVSLPGMVELSVFHTQRPS